MRGRLALSGLPSLCQAGGQRCWRARPVRVVGGPLGGAEGTEPQIGGIEGLAFDPISMNLYGVDGSRLIQLDPLDGSGTVIGSFGFEDVTCLACDPLTGTLYGVDSLQDLLLTIDPSTGEATAVGSTGASAIIGLAFDPCRSRGPVQILLTARCGRQPPLRGPGNGRKSTKKGVSPPSLSPCSRRSLCAR